MDLMTYLILIKRFINLFLTLINNCLMGFFNEKRYIERFALSGGGLTPGLLVGFLLIWSCFSGGGPDAGAAGS